jgi:hypothetical protein
MLRNTHFLLCLLFGIVLQGVAQDTVILQRKVLKNEHRIRLPQNIIFTYETGKKQYAVTDINESAIMSRTGPVDMSFKYFNARRLKPKGVRIFGGIIGLTGLVGAIVSATRLNSDDYKPAIYLGGSLALFWIGGSISDTSHKYKLHKWHVKPPPAEHGNTRVYDNRWELYRDYPR